MCAVEKSRRSVRCMIRVFWDTRTVFPHDVIIRLMGVTAESAKVEIRP